MQPHARSCTHASVTTVLFGTVRTIHNMCLLSQTPNGLLHTNNKHRNVLVGTFLIHSHWAHKTNDMHCNVHKNCNIPQSNFPTQLLKNKLCCNHFQLYVHVLHLPLRCALMRHQRSTLLHSFGFRVSGFGFRRVKPVSGFGFRVSSLATNFRCRFRVSSFGFRVSSLETNFRCRFRVSGLAFRVSGFVA